MFDPAMFAGMSSLMSAFFPGAPGGPGLPAGASEEQRAFMHHFHTAFSKLVATSGGSGAAALGPAPALPPFDPAALFGGQPAAAAPAAAAQPAAVAVKQEAADGVAERSPTLAGPAGPQPQQDAEAEATNNSAGEEAEAMQVDGEEAAAAGTPQPAAPAAAAAGGQPAAAQQAAAEPEAQPADGAPADAADGSALQASGSGTTAPTAAPAVAAADAAAAGGPASGLTPEQAALQQQALYIGQVMMSLASVFPGMAAAISAMCGMAAAAGFTGPQLPPVSAGRAGGAGWLHAFATAGMQLPGLALHAHSARHGCCHAAAALIARP